MSIAKQLELVNTVGVVARGKLSVILSILDTREQSCSTCPDRECCWAARLALRRN